MELPALFYGPYHDVKRRTSRIVTQMRKGADWMALVEAEGFLDTAAVPGFIVLDGPSPLLGGQPHFQQWLLWAQYHDKQAREWARGREDVHEQDAQEEAIFQQSLSRHWSTLGLVANWPWLFSKHRHRPFLRAVRQYWNSSTLSGRVTRLAYRHPSRCGRSRPVSNTCWPTSVSQATNSIHRCRPVGSMNSSIVPSGTCIDAAMGQSVGGQA